MPVTKDVSMVGGTCLLIIGQHVLKLLRIVQVLPDSANVRRQRRKNWLLQTHLERSTAFMGWLHLKYMIMPSIMSTLRQTKTMAAMVAGGYAGCGAEGT